MTTSHAGAPDRTAVDRVQRLLALVPWVMAHPTATVEEVCARFGLSREQLLGDLELLFVSGLPPYGPGDLIEAWVEQDRVHIALADYFARAPRLTWREAAGLYLAGRALGSLPGLDDAGALPRALAKLSAVLPAEELAQVQELGERVWVQLEADPSEAAPLGVLARAAATRTRVELDYYTGSREELTHRQVDPWVVFPALGHWYVSGWCHLAGGERLFRVDRIVAARPTEARFELPAGFDPTAARDVIAPRSHDAAVVGVLDLDPSAEWAASYFRVDRSERTAEGRLRVWLPARSLAWLVRLTLRLAPAARPVEPGELRAAVRAAAREQLVRYEASAGAG